MTMLRQSTDTVDPEYLADLDIKIFSRRFELVFERVLVKLY